LTLVTTNELFSYEMSRTWYIQHEFFRVQIHLPLLAGDLEGLVAAVWLMRAVEPERVGHGEVPARRRHAWHRRHVSGGDSGGRDAG
jgi:hypothetical protein